MHACAAAYAAHAAPQVPINPYYNPAAHQAYTDAVEKFEWSKFLRKCSTRQHALVLVRASQFCWNYGIFQHGHEFVKNFLEAAERTGKYRASKRTLYVEKFLKMMKDLGKRRKDRKIREAEEAERKRKEEEAEAKRRGSRRCSAKQKSRSVWKQSKCVWKRSRSVWKRSKCVWKRSGRSSSVLLRFAHSEGWSCSLASAVPCGWRLSDTAAWSPIFASSWKRASI